MFWLVLCAASANSVADGYIWDQSSYTLGPSTRRNVGLYSPIGQEFTPDSSILTVVQLYMHNYDSSPTGIAINILADSITGTPAGSSSTSILPGDFDGTVTFNFDPVPLQPQHLYVLEIELVYGSAGVYGPSTGSPYPDGRAILWGEPVDYIDLWFREGVWVAADMERFSCGSIKRAFH